MSASSVETRRRRFRRRAIAVAIGVPAIFVFGVILTDRIDTDRIEIDAEWVRDAQGLVVGYTAIVTNHGPDATEADCTVDVLAPASNDTVLATDNFLTEEIPPDGSVSHEGSFQIVRDRGEEFAIRDLPSASCQPFP